MKTPCFERFLQLENFKNSDIFATTLVAQSQIRITMIRNPGARNQQNKWTTLPSLQSQFPYWNPICSGQSLWITTYYNDGERGMAQFDCTSNAMKQPIGYPQDFQPTGHSMCGINDNTIMVVDGVNGEMRTFNVKNKKFGKKISIKKMGSSP